MIPSRMYKLILSAGVMIGTTVGVAAAKPTQPVVQLTYWNMWSGQWEKVIQNMVNDFNNTHPNIHVNVLSIPSNADTKLLTAIAAGNPPDVFTEWNPTVGQFAQKHGLMDLDQFMVGPYAGMKKWFYPSAYASGVYQGKIYALPWTMGDVMLFYNKSMMKDAGLNPNNPPKTIAQLDAQSSKMWKVQNGTVRQIGMYPSWWDVWPATWKVNLEKKGKYNLLSPNALKLMSWIASYKKYPFSQVSAFLSAVGSSNGGSDPFIIGKEAFEITGMWEMPLIQQYNPKLQYGIAPLPAPPGGQSNVTFTWGNYNEIPVGSKHPKQAWEFIAWLDGYHNEAWAAKNFPLGGWIPSSPHITAMPAYQKWINQDPLRKPFLKLMNNPKDGIRPNTPVGALYETDIGNAVNYVLQGKKTPKQALQDVQNSVNKALANPNGNYS